MTPFRTLMQTGELAWCEQGRREDVLARVYADTAQQVIAETWGVPLDQVEVRYEHGEMVVQVKPPLNIDIINLAITGETFTEES